MHCQKCGSLMIELSPERIDDPQPTRYVARYRCDEPECERQGKIVTAHEATAFLQAMRAAVNTAKKSGKQVYVFAYPLGRDFYASHEYKSDWLFRVYPGGRKILSMRGKKLVEAPNE